MHGICLLRFYQSSVLVIEVIIIGDMSKKKKSVCVCVIGLVQAESEQLGHLGTACVCVRGRSWLSPCCAPGNAVNTAAKANSCSFERVKRVSVLKGSFSCLKLVS